MLLVRQWKHSSQQSNREEETKMRVEFVEGFEELEELEEVITPAFGIIACCH
jgi:hypothetical protein